MSFAAESGVTIEVKMNVLMISLKGQLTSKELDKVRQQWFEKSWDIQIQRVEIYCQSLRSIDYLMMHQMNIWLMRTQANGAHVCIRGATRAINEIFKLCQSNQWATIE